MGGVGSASGKLILFGEHAAVYGHPAIGLPMAERTVVTLAGSGKSEWDLEAVGEEDRGTAARILASLEGLRPDLASLCDTRGRSAVSIISQVPRGVGFGSSAALTAAFAGAFLANSGVGTEGVWRLAHETERLFHGTPSGIDTGLAIMDGLRAFLPRPPGLPEHEPLGGVRLHLVVAAVPRAGNCGALVGALGERMRAGDHAARGAVETLGAIAAEARGILRQTGGAADLGRLARDAQGRLRGLGLSTPEMDFLIKEGERAGALGGKLSGAGGGGAFYLVMPDQESAGRAAASLTEAASGRRIPMAALPRPLCVP